MPDTNPNSNDVMNAATDAVDNVTDAVDKETTLYQILTGVFAGLSLILIVVTIWVLAARKSGRTQPVDSIQGGFSLGALGSLMSTS